MATIFRGLASEFLKHRPTFVMWLLLLVPLIVASITFLTALTDDRLSINDPWRWYISFNYRPYFHIFVFLQILFVSHVNYIEHRCNTWKNLRVLPVPFGVIYFSKILFAYLLLMINVLLFYFLVISGGYLLKALRPELGFQNAYWLEAFFPTVKFFVASSCTTAIIYWLSFSFKSIMLPIVLGLIGYASGFALFLVTSRRGYNGLPYSEWHPFNFSGYAFDSFGTGTHFINLEYVWYGFTSGILILFLHYHSNRNKAVQ